MDFLQKYFYGVFELPLTRNAQKRTKKKVKEKKVGRWVAGSGIWQMYGGVRRFFLGRPLGPDQGPRAKGRWKKRKEATCDAPTYPPLEVFEFLVPFFLELPMQRNGQKKRQKGRRKKRQERGKRRGFLPPLNCFVRSFLTWINTKVDWHSPG
jgi:hypothetical protein